MKTETLREGRQPVILELGAGNFSNLPPIIREHPGARVIGIEHPEQKISLQLAQQSQGKYFSELLDGFHEAVRSGAEIWFCDFTLDLPEQLADEIILIAPDPLGQEGMTNRKMTADAVCRLLKPRGHIQVFTELESMASYLLNTFLDLLQGEGSIEEIK